MHCFEIRTPNCDYYVGEDTTYGRRESTTSKPTVPPPETGLGAHLAKTWENSIRQALMPVTSTQQGNNNTSVPTSMKP